MPPWYHRLCPCGSRQTQRGNQHGTWHGPPSSSKFMYVLVPEGEPNTATNMEPNQLWDTSSSKFTINCYLMLLASLLLSSFLGLLIVYCRLLFLASLSRFLPVAVTFWNALRRKYGTQHVSKEVPTQPFFGGVAEI